MCVFTSLLVASISLPSPEVIAPQSGTATDREYMSVLLSKAIGSASSHCIWVEYCGALGTGLKSGFCGYVLLGLWLKSYVYTVNTHPLS
jgi:hypothetical protein